MKKSKKTIYRDLGIALLILVMSFLPYIHDFEVFRGMKGFSGFSSLRIGMYFVAMFIVSLTGWIGWFLTARGKEYRFAILAPIFMLAFQLGIYLFDARKTASNEFSTKIVLNICFALFLTLFYFYKKRKE